MLFDQWRAQGWDIATHAGFVTYIYPRSGAKLWEIMHIKEGKLSDGQDRERLWELYDCMVDETWEKLVEDTVMGTLLIEQGDVL